jgi:hypothetical protein
MARQSFFILQRCMRAPIKTPAPVHSSEQAIRRKNHRLSTSSLDRLPVALRDRVCEKAVHRRKSVAIAATVRDTRAAAQVFAGLLKAQIFDEVLLGLREPSDAVIVGKARDAAKSMHLLLNDGRF